MTRRCTAGESGTGEGRKMKQKAVFLTVLLLTMTLTAGALAGTVIIPESRIQEEGLRFTRGEALTKAAGLLAEQTDSYRAENYRQQAGSVRLPDGRDAWIVIMERCVDEPVGNLYAVFSADDGEVIELYYPDNEVYTWVLLQWIEAKHGHRKDWGVGDEALFDWLFSSGDSMFNPAQAAVSSEEAVRIAAGWLKAQFGITYDDADVSYSGYDAGNGRTAYDWVVSFNRNGKQTFVVFVNTETGEVKNSFDLSEGRD